MREVGHNAISTLLQPPIVRAGLLPYTGVTAAAAGYKAPTSKDIPPVVLTNIPHVPPENFRDYLARIGPLFDACQRAKSDPEQPQWPKKDKALEQTERFTDALTRNLDKDASTATSSLRPSSASSLSPVTTPGAPQRRSSAQARRNRNEPPPLSTIPSVYFDEDFHLENPRTFDVVSEHAEIVRPPPGSQSAAPKQANGAAHPPRRALATNAILQEKISWYMDTVEIHLISNISSASTGFFAALGSLKELQTEAEESVARIQGLREDLRRLDQEVAVAGLEVAAKRRRRANLQKLGRATAQVQSVVEYVQKADEMIEAGSYDDAADQMERVGRLICGKAEPGADSNHLIDLRPLKALQGLDSGLQELQMRIGAGFSKRFTSILIDDIRQHVERVPNNDTLKRWSRQRGIPPTYMETTNQFRNDLKLALQALSRAGHTAAATAAYREAVQKEMKAIIRKHLPSSSDDDVDSMVSTSTRGGSGRLSQQEKSTILARNLRAMEGEDAEKLLISSYAGVGEALRRVSTQTKILLDITSSIQVSGLRSPTNGPVKSPRLPAVDEQASSESAKPPNVQDDFSEALDMSSLLGQAVDTAQTQISRVLKVRNEQTVRLSKPGFLRYFTLNRLFADECEGISGRSGQALKGIINAQITSFVQVLGTSETERIAKLLDGDSWNAVDFGEIEDALLQRILHSMSSDPAEWTKATPIWELHVAPSEKATQINGEALANGQPNGKAPAKPAYIDEHRYTLVASVMSLLPTIDLFLSLTASIPSVTPQISASLLEVLRTFNSRSCQLILGAGATRSAGLKNITTKHLALASQALSFVVALVPYMRECVRRHLPAGQSNVLAEFDKTKRLCQDHQSGIHDKLVEIMTSRSQSHVRTMMSINFDASTPVNDKPSAYAETLTKETLTLHRVLSRHLSETELLVIMRQIFEAYREQWTKAFGYIEVKTTAGEQRLLRDAQCFETRLPAVEGLNNVGKEVVGVVKARVDGDVKPAEAASKKSEKQDAEAKKS